MDNDFDLANFGDDIFEDFTKNAPQVAAENTAAHKRKIPVVMVSGFLGAGKTSLLNNILRDSPQLKIGAIVNDFGKINIDNRLVSGTFSENQIELSNGCICCMLGDNGLREPLDILANENSELDAILVEASGIAEPYDLMNTLRYSGNQFTFFGGNIYLIDAKNFELAQKEFPTHFKKCLKTADILLITKTDLVSPEKVTEIRQFARELNARALILESDNAKIDPRILFENLEKLPDQSLKPNESHAETCHSHDHHHHHIHDEFQSVDFSSRKPLDPREFINFLDNLPQNLFRMKGFCYFGMKGYEQKYTLQIVGKTIDIRAEEWSDNEKISTELVLIGAGMNITEIEKQLQKLIDTSPEEITPENMMNFERFMLKK